MSKDRTLAILFADVVGSTRLFEQLGDARARDMVAQCVDLMRAATVAHRGEVIKTIGDEIMATFANCDDALDAASQMQGDISVHPELKVDGQAVAIRVGSHYGPVMVEDNDVFGAAVHTANRMTSAAKAGQIIITDAFVEQVSQEWRDAVRQVDVAVPRGQHGEVAMYEVLWQQGDVTSMVPIATLGGDQKPVRLKLEQVAQTLLLDERDRPTVTIGRAEDNDVIVSGTLVSRLHAKIESGRHRFMLIDQSTNGTFVLPDGGEETYVRRDSVNLRGTGLIGFGSVPREGDTHTVRYTLED